MTERPRGFEFKHLECPQVPALVDLVTNDYAKFYWELTGTQTVVAKESHLESGEYNSDNLYSVTTTERFVAMDFRRATDIPNLPRIKEVEKEYFQLCVALANLGASPLDNYSTPPYESFEVADLLGISALKALLSPGYWLWMFTLWYIREAKKIGVLGVLFPAYGYRKRREPERLAQFSLIRARLDALMSESKSILNMASQ